jgi:hypothetical protein
MNVKITTKIVAPSRKNSFDTEMQRNVLFLLLSHTWLPNNIKLLTMATEKQQ